MTGRSPEKPEYGYAVKMLESSVCGDNAQILAELAIARDYDARYFDLVRAIGQKTGTVAFHLPVSCVATAYLVMAGEKDYDGVDENVLYVIDAFRASQQ